MRTQSPTQGSEQPVRSKCTLGRTWPASWCLTVARSWSTRSRRRPRGRRSGRACPPWTWPGSMTSCCTNSWGVPSWRCSSPGGRSSQSASWPWTWRTACRRRAWRCCWTPYWPRSQCSNIMHLKVGKWSKGKHFFFREINLHGKGKKLYWGQFYYYYYVLLPVCHHHESLCWYYWIYALLVIKEDISKNGTFLQN